MEYQRLFVLFSNKVEQILIKLIVALAVLVMLIHLAMQIPEVRFVLSRVEKWEGVEYI